MPDAPAVAVSELEVRVAGNNRFIGTFKPNCDVQLVIETPAGNYELFFSTRNADHRETRIEFDAEGRMGRTIVPTRFVGDEQDIPVPVRNVASSTRAPAPRPAPRPRPAPIHPLPTPAEASGSQPSAASSSSAGPDRTSSASRSRQGPYDRPAAAPFPSRPARSTRLTLRSHVSPEPADDATLVDDEPPAPASTALQGMMWSRERIRSYMGSNARP